MKEIHNFKKNTVRKEIEKKIEAEPVAEAVPEVLEEPALTKQEFYEKLVEIAAQPMPVIVLGEVDEVDEVESIPYTAVPANNSFGQAVYIASGLADMLGDDIGYFHFNKSSDTFAIEIGHKRVSISEISDDADKI